MYLNKLGHLWALAAETVLPVCLVPWLIPFFRVLRRVCSLRLTEFPLQFLDLKLCEKTVLMVNSQVGYCFWANPFAQVAKPKSHLHCSWIICVLKQMFGSVHF